MIDQMSCPCQSPSPLADPRTAALIRALIAVLDGSDLPTDVASRSASVDDIRSELQRRERVDVLVQR
jgi:hypothetical protein